jgi:hypothetical protein
MLMVSTSVLPIVGGVFFVLFGLSTAFGASIKSKNIWILPALLSLAFFALSVQAVIAEGQMGFWEEHTHSVWGNQIWFDLLFAASIGWLFILPRARAANMNLPVWFLAIASSGNIAFLAMVSRLLYLESHPRK